MNPAALVRKLRRYGPVGSAVLGAHALNYWVRKHVLRRRYFVRSVHDYRLRLDLRDPGLARDLAVRGRREEQLKYILDRLLRPGQTVLDVGANVGYYAILEARRVGPEGHVYAIEPEPHNFRMLNANVRLNGLERRIETVHAGAADRPGRMRLLVSELSNLHTFRRQSRAGDARRALRGESVEVETVTLAGFLRGRRPVDLIRMDIEGFEVEVLTGLLPAIEDGTFGGAIVFEAHTPDYGGEHDIREPLRRLFERGYRARWVTSNDEPEPRLRGRGYEPTTEIETAGLRRRGVYEDVAADDLLELVFREGGVRDVALVRAPGG
ncbi:MAG: FkbM family methyltransferase [Gemmatimonadota bacterium]